MTKQLGKIEDAIEKRIREDIQDKDYTKLSKEIMESDVMFLLERLDAARGINTKVE